MPSERRDRGRGRGRGGSRHDSLSRSVLVSKALSRLLRHAAEQERIPIDSHGYVRVDHLLGWQRLKSMQPPVTFEEVIEVVEESEKKRFALKYVAKVSSTIEGTKAMEALTAPETSQEPATEAEVETETQKATDHRQEIPLKYSEPQFDGEGLHFLPHPSSALFDGSLAHLPMLQELPDPMSSAMWCNWVEINLQTAERLGIRQGDIVEITSSQGSIQAAAFPSPGIAPDVVAMPVGQGHENFTRYATGRGENPIKILAPMKEEATGALAWAATRVTV